MKKNEKILAPALVEETELDAEELDNVTGGAHPGGVNLTANPVACDGSVMPVSSQTHLIKQTNNSFADKLAQSAG